MTTTLSVTKAYIAFLTQAFPDAYTSITRWPLTSTGTAPQKEIVIEGVIVPLHETWQRGQAVVKSGSFGFRCYGGNALASWELAEEVLEAVKAAKIPGVRLAKTAEEPWPLDDPTVKDGNQAAEFYIDLTI